MRHERELQPSIRSEMMKKHSANTLGTARIPSQSKHIPLVRESPMLSACMTCMVMFGNGYKTVIRTTMMARRRTVLRQQPEIAVGGWSAAVLGPQVLTVSARRLAADT